MTASQLMLPAHRAFNSDGAPEVGATASLYLSGTLTPALFYSDSALSNSIGSTITANAAGNFAPMPYGDTTIAYRLIIKDATGAPLDDVDPFYFGQMIYNGSVTGHVTADTRATLAGIASTTATVYLTESGREGIFTWSSTNNAANVTGDPNQGVYVAPSSDVTGASGAWVRKDAVIKWAHFGTVGTANDLATLQACNDWFFASVRTDRILDTDGSFNINGTLNLGPASASPTGRLRYNIRGEFQVTQTSLTEVFETIKFQGHMPQTTWNGGITVIGNDVPAFASRIHAVGITFFGNQVCRFTGNIRCYGFWYIGVLCLSNGTIFDDDLVLGTVQCYYCGSGYSGAGSQSLTSTWSTPVRSGTSRSTAQLDTISVATLPDALLTTYAAVGGQPFYIVTSTGNWHYVQSWDRTAKTLSIYPYLYAADYNAGAGSGTLRYVFGGAVWAGGGDSFVEIDHLHAIDCGMAIASANLYGIRINQSNTAACGVGLSIGSGPANASIGTSLDGFYTEGNDADIILCAPPTSGSVTAYIMSTYAINLAKCYTISALDTATNARVLGFGSGIGSATCISNVTVAERGFIHTVNDGPVTNLASTTANFFDHSRPSRRFTQNVNSQTVTIQTVSPSYNLLFGYRGSTWCYVGTGANGAPTGSFTFVPPTGGTINGGAVNANAVFSNPWTGPVTFEIFFTDAAQLTWIVRPVTGQAGVVLQSQSAVAVSHTGDTVATTLGTVTIPANSLGANGRIEIKCRFSFSGTNSTRTVTVAFGGSTVFSSSAVASTISNFGLQADIANRNATNSQYSGTFGVNSSAQVAQGLANLTIDTTVDQTVTFVGAVANAADTVKLESYQVIVYPKA